MTSKNTKSKIYNIFVSTKFHLCLFTAKPLYAISHFCHFSNETMLNVIQVSRSDKINNVYISTFFVCLSLSLFPFFTWSDHLRKHEYMMKVFHLSHFASCGYIFCVHGNNTHTHKMELFNFTLWAHVSIIYNRIRSPVCVLVHNVHIYTPLSRILN